MNDTPKILDFSHKFVFSPENKLPVCDSPLGYIVWRDNTVEKICAFGHVADWQRFESTEIARLMAEYLAASCHVSLRNESDEAVEQMRAADCSHEWDTDENGVFCVRCYERKG